MKFLWEQEKMIKTSD